MEEMTVVMTNYNKGPFIKDAVDCLLRQDVSSLSLIHISEPTRPY